MINYFKFRFKQFFRAFNINVQLANYLIIIGAVIFFVKLPWSNLYPILFLFPIYLFHFQRNDILFLKNKFRFWQFILFVEYLFILIFISVLCNNYEFNFDILYAFLGVIILLFLKIKKNIYVIKLDFLSNDFFEIKSIIRKNIFGFIFQLILFYISFYHPFTLFLVLFLSLEFLSNIFSDFESKELVQSYFNEKKLEIKIKKNLILINFLFLPLYIAFAFTNFQYIQYLIYYMVVLNLFIVERILIKYKKYKCTENYHLLFISDIMMMGVKSALILPTVISLKTTVQSAEKNISKYVDH